MSNVFLASDNIISPLGTTCVANYTAVKSGKSGIALHQIPLLSPEPFYASLIEQIPVFEGKIDYTRFERLCIASIQKALSNTAIKMSDSDTVFILSTTKGNISLMSERPVTDELRSRISLPTTAKLIARHFNAANNPLVVSNACISGVLAIVVAQRLLRAGKYKHAVITGADELSGFIISGFGALHAIGSGPCRPFDKKRTGITLGEGAATMVLTTDETLALGPIKIKVGAGAGSNDANHISGPSRTGAELSQAVNVTLMENHVQVPQLAFISAHGTATLFNDEMESKAFELSGLGEVPLHSLKGFFGHTLGAAGVIESLISIYSLRDKIVLPSINYEESGVTGHISVSSSLCSTSKTVALKTASGFGGCNAAVIYSCLN